MTLAEKRSLLEDLLARLTASHKAAVAAQAETARGVVHEDARAEGDKDMRSTEQSYVARGQAMRVETLAAELSKVAALKLRSFSGEDRIALGACITVQEEQAAPRVLFMSPAGGGEVLLVGGKKISVITPASPLGRILLGALSGEIVELARDGRNIELEILTVR